MSKSFSIKSVYPRRFVRSDFVYNEATTQQCVSDYNANNLEQYEEIERKRKQIINKHIKLDPGKVTPIDATDVKFIPGAFEAFLPKLVKAAQAFFDAAKKLPASVQQAATRYNITSKTWHFGRWERQGNKDAEAALMQYQCAKDFVAAMEDISTEVDGLFKNNFPELWNFLKQVIARDEYGYVSKVYRMFALNDSTSDWHTDYADFIDGYCAVIPFGNFEGGELLLPDINLKIPARAGDIIFFRSHFLLHKNAPVLTGHRQSLVFYTHQLAVSRYLMSINKELKSTQDAIDYCRAYWSYKVPPKYSKPVRKIADFDRIADAEGRAISLSKLAGRKRKRDQISSRTTKNRGSKVNKKKKARS